MTRSGDRARPTDHSGRTDRMQDGELPHAPRAPAPPAAAATDPAVSVVLPAWNVERYLARAVRSALAQEGPSLEVIVVEDRSPDGTAAVAERLAAEDRRVRVVRNPENLGCGGSRNAGARAARGRWIALLDADDAYAPGRLDRLVAVAEDEGLDAVSDLPLLYDLAADEMADGQLPADGRLEILDPRRYLEAAVLPESPLDYGLLKPIYRRSLVEDGRWLYPERARHGADFFGFLDSLIDGVRFGVLHEARYVFSARVGEKSGAFSPGSVTPVNYRAIAANTADKIAELERARPAIPGMTLEEATALLRLRIAKCEDLNARYGWNTLRKGAWRRHAAWLRQDPRNAPLLLRLAAGKARRRLTGAGAP